MSDCHSGPRRRRRRRGHGHGHGAYGGPAQDAEGLVLLIGSPNVGKSVVFNELTGLYATVSNYPGTTVALSHGSCRLDGVELEAVDTPGMYSLIAISEEERVGRRLIFDPRVRCIIHVVDAKNLDRMLPLTLEMVEAGLPVVLDVNMVDEAENLGITVDTEELGRRLGVPAVATVAVSGRGIPELRSAVAERVKSGNGSLQVPHTSSVRDTGRKIAALLEADYDIDKQALALLLLQEDDELMQQVAQKEPERARAIHQLIHETNSSLAHSLGYQLRMEYQEEARELVRQAVSTRPVERRGFGVWLGRICMEPLTGVPILLAVLYFGLYKLVGGVGAGILVDWIEGVAFGEYINPVAIRLTEMVLPWQNVVAESIRDLVIGPYGVVTLGLRYAIAIILPIVGIFFLFFSVLEDSGYFPRLAMLVNRLFRAIGLNGRAVIPIVLGFGCGTMAVMVTRIFETRRERIIAIFLLSLAVPCSAQLGVITALLSSEGHLGAFAFWAVFVGVCFLAAGFLASKLMPGSPPSFYMELPPLRFPQLKNVLSKTWSRLRWYFWEVLPLFLLASVILWLGTTFHIFHYVEVALSYPLRAMGLPSDASTAFLFGFFRRDYGAAGLFDLSKQGLLTIQQLTVACVVLTLFLPCVAQLLITYKEMGLKITGWILAIILPFAFLAGVLTNVLLGAFPQLIGL